MNYTKKWNSIFVENIKKNKIKNQKLCLEIGCFEGLTSNYIAKNILSNDGLLICVDPLEDCYLVDNLSNDDHLNNKEKWSYFNGQYQRFLENTRENTTKQKIKLIREKSSEALPKLQENYQNSFDFIYIDGDHREEPVYQDALNSYKLCKVGGTILFDDYLWSSSDKSKPTKKGIDRFLKDFAGKLEVVDKNYQLMVKKII